MHHTELVPIMLHEVLHNYHYYRIHPDMCQLILPDYQYHQQLYNQHNSCYQLYSDNPGESADTYQDVYDNNGNYAGLHATLWEQALYDAFGEHFLNTRLYLMENALSDCGLTPTENDIIDIQTGNLPEQIRADFTHFNSYGYYSKAKAIYLKGI